MTKVDDTTRLHHMLDAAKEAVEFAENQYLEALYIDRKLALSLTKLVEIIGEAASKVTQETRQQYSTLPWQFMIGIRNRLTHGYFDIDWSILWETVNRDLPPLIEELEAILQLKNSPL